MNSKLQTKLKSLPANPGVYFHKDKTGEVIYVGKAAVLKNRVRQYFQSSRLMDNKTQALVAEIVDTDWIETDSEIDALFLEAEMIKRYMPRYNILLRDDRSLAYIRIDMKSDWPYVSLTHNPADDGADYFGPYYNSQPIKKALRYLRRIFPYYIVKTNDSNLQKSSRLDQQLGLAPDSMTSIQYKANLRRLISYIKGDRQKLINDLTHDMKVAADQRDFETAAIIRNQLSNLRQLQQRIMFGDKEFINISKDKALQDLTDLFHLTKIPVRIEGYDVSHMGGVNVVASMVVFKNGASDRSAYRKFKMRIDQNNDFFNMNETLTRRLSDKNLHDWGRPDLILIDGGKGQLDAALQARNQAGQQAVPFIGLAKRDEQIVIKNDEMQINKVKLVELKGCLEITDDFTLINLPKSSDIIKLLQRIRDESHRFAVSYHTVLKRTKQTASLLDEIPGIGPKTRTKLIRKFGSLKQLKNESEASIVAIIGPAKTRLVMSYLKVI